MYQSYLHFFHYLYYNIYIVVINNPLLGLQVAFIQVLNLMFTIVYPFHKFCFHCSSNLFGRCSSPKRQASSLANISVYESRCLVPLLYVHRQVFE